jgi:hypothetical protein
MPTKPYLPHTWTDPRQSILPSSIQGNGIIANAPIRAGEVVEIIGGVVMTEAGFRHFQASATRYNAVQIDEDLHLVEVPQMTAERLGSINHSCDSNLWMADEVTVAARRDIAAGEELTIDYALFTTQPDWVLDHPCTCGVEDCRGVITGNDWQLPHVQARYYPHFTPFINRRIEQASTPAADGATLQ